MLMHGEVMAQHGGAARGVVWRRLRTVRLRSSEVALIRVTRRCSTAPFNEAARWHSYVTFIPAEARHGTVVAEQSIAPFCNGHWRSRAMRRQSDVQQGPVMRRQCKAQQGGGDVAFSTAPR